MTVREFMDQYPQVLRTFMDLRLLCVGCPAEAFHTLADVAREHQIDSNRLLQCIYEAIRNDIA